MTHNMITGIFLKINLGKKIIIFNWEWVPEYQTLWDPIEKALYLVLL